MAWMQSDFVWHINLHKGAAIVEMQISHEISYCVEYSERTCMVVFARLYRDIYVLTVWSIVNVHVWWYLLPYIVTLYVLYGRY